MLKSKIDTHMNLIRFYIYKHTFKNGKIYIGKGTEDRSNDFRNRSTYWKRVYAKYGNPMVEILANNITEEFAFILEVAFIKMNKTIHGLQVINLTDGGEGISGYNHTDDSKNKISTVSKIAWNNPIYRSTVINKSKEYWKSDEGFLKRSNQTKELWTRENYREKKKEMFIKLWEDKEHIEKMKNRMRGENNPSARRANIYEYSTDKLLAESVVSAEWARDNGYSRSKLQVTAKADRTKPSSKNNPHHHKGVYMRYIDGK